MKSDHIALVTSSLFVAIECLQCEL